MKKFGKMRIAAAIALVAALLGSATASAVGGVTAESATPTGFETQAVEITGGNEALSGWQYYFYNETIKTYYQSNELFVRATKDGRTGNALHIQRDTAKDELVMYSYAFDVRANQNYVIGAFIKSICTDTTENKVCFKVKEQNAEGNVVGDEFAVLNSVEGKQDDWTETTFSYKTSVSAKTLVLKICAEGIGDYYVDDITVKTCDAAVNTKTYRMQGIGKVSDKATDEVGEAGKNNMNVLTAANIYADSSDGDNASLLVNDGEIFKTNFSMLEASKKYKLSFKYKMIEAGSENRLSIRMNYCKIGETSNNFYVDINGGNAEDWTEYTLDFTAEGEATFGMAITAYAKYIIDELKITCLEDDDNMQFIVNSSFSGAYLEGYKFGDNFNVAKQEDGTFVFVAGNGSYDSTFGGRGYFTIPVVGLTAGEEYTLSYDYRFNGAAWVNSVLTYLNGSEIMNFTGTAKTWTVFSKKFVAAGNNEIKFYGPSYYYWPTYYRNIRVTDSKGNVYNINPDLIAPESIFGENEFSYGTFEGNVNYVAKDWTFEGEGNIYGFAFDTRWESGAKPDYKVCLNGSADNAATAITKEIDVTGKNIVSVDKQIYYTADSSFGSNLAVTVLAGNNEISANEKGYFVLPEGIKSIRVKFSANEFVTFKKVYVNAHAHGEDCANVGGEQYNAYAFASDNSSCTATRYYACGGVAKTETAKTVFGGDSATFTETGKATYTAVFKDEDFDTQTVTVETPMKSSPEVKMIKNGASVRTSEPYGIRWAAGIRTADWNKLIEVYGENNVKAGVIVAPLDYVEQADEFTISAFNAASLKYADIVSDTFNAEVNAMAEGYSGFYASLVNIQAGNLNRKFAARAYVAVEKDGVVTYYYGEYSAENQARSIYEVSKSAVASSTEKEAVKEFAKGVLNKVIDVTVENGNAVLTEIAGYASPYAVSLSGNVLTITAADGADINNVKIVCVNGKNYKPTVSGNAVTVSID